MDYSFLLALPKELRLEIWSYVLIDPSMKDLVLQIRRKHSCRSTSSQRYSNSLSKTSFSELPDLHTEFEKPRSIRVNLQLLRTCRFIYEDALPILYHSVTFYVRDLEGIFPLFLARLSPFAKSHIRYIKLSIREYSRYSSSFFHWAFTCAQVAGLADLRRVDLEGDWPVANSEYHRRTIFFPLVKIKAPKRFLSDHEAEFQTLLDNATKKMEGKALVCKASMAADILKERKGRMLRV